MEVKVIDRLTAARAVVGDDAKAALEATVERQPIGGREDSPEERSVLGPQVEHRRNVFSRDQEQMNGRLRASVLDHNQLWVFVREPRGNRTREDLAEHAVSVHSRLVLGPTVQSRRAKVN